MSSQHDMLLTLREEFFSQPMGEFDWARYSELLARLNDIARTLPVDRMAVHFRALDPRPVTPQERRRTLDQLKIILSSALDAASETESATPFVDPQVLERLAQLTHKKLRFSMLIQLCRELNSNVTQGNIISSLALIRAITDHVVPVFVVVSDENARNPFRYVCSETRGLDETQKTAFQHLATLRPFGNKAIHQSMKNNINLTHRTQDLLFYRPHVELLLNTIIDWIVRQVPPCVPNSQRDQGDKD